MRKMVLLGAVLSQFMCVAAPSYAATYGVVGLGHLGGSSGGLDINDAGQVSGSSQTAGFAEGAERAFLYSNGAMQDLGTLDGAPAGSRGSISEGYAINNAGQVVGYSQTAGGAARAFLYSNGAMQDLGTLGGTWSYGWDINDAGQVVGDSITAGDTDPRAFLYSNGVMQDLGTLGGTYSSGGGINNAGQVVGYSQTAGGTARAFLYSNGAMRDLGVLSGHATSYGTAINDAGQVVGSSRTDGGGASRAFLYSNGVMQDLGALGAHAESWGWDINNAGQVVGWSITAGGAVRAFLYSNGAMQDINALIPADSGWVLTEAFGINDLGQITGRGVFNGRQQAFLATPVPLPGTLGLLISGLAGLGVARRARSHSARAQPPFCSIAKISRTGGIGGRVESTLQAHS